MKRAILIISLGIAMLYAFSACIVVSRGDPATLYKTTDDSVKLRHCSFPIVYLINNDVPDDVEKLIIESFNYWDDQTDKKLFHYFDRTEWKPGDPDAGIFIVVGMSDKEKPEEDKNVMGFVEPPTYWTDTGCLDKGGISLYKDSTEKFDDVLRTIIRHEIGHILGFGHSSHSEDLMYYGIQVNLFDNLKELSEWELKAFRLFYGEDVFSQQD